MKNVEREYKSQLSFTQYKSLINELKKNPTFEESFQLNYYYDDQYFSLLENGITLRIRQKGETLTLERKVIRKLSENGERIADEYSSSINNFPMSIIYGSNNYNYIGVLITKRIYCVFGNTTIFLDANYYLGTVDYELEIELSENAILPSIFKDWFNLNKQPRGKYRRFVDKLKQTSESYEL